MKRRWWIGGAMLAAFATATGLSAIGKRIWYGPRIGAGYAAELMCGGVFVSERDPDHVLHDDLLPVDPLLRYAAITVDRAQNTVTARLGLSQRSALYRPGLGCTLIGRDGVDALLQQAEGVAPMPVNARPSPWPIGDHVVPTESPALAAVLDDALAEAGGVSTRAIIIVKDGRIIAERYRTGFSQDTRLLGWSLSKSVTAALVGALVAEGKLSLTAPAPLPAWQQADDPHKTITLSHLLTMTSGLQFDESYAPGDDATAMLFRQDDMAGYAAQQKLAHPPGAVWSYSSGTTNIVSQILVNAVGGSLANIYNFARTHLFEPAGMTSAVFEPDSSGNPVGSSYLYMTARDWARFGLLYLNNGLLGWQRILPADWVAQTRQPVHTTDGVPVAYGLQFWLNSDGRTDSSLRLPHCPSDLYMADGHNGQVVAIVPSAGVVFVRLGWDTGPAAFDTDARLATILAALKEAG